MTKEEQINKVNKILYQILGASKRAGDELLFTCPFCLKSRFSINMNDKLGQWKCWVCNEKGRYLLSLLKRLHAPKDCINELSEIFKDDSWTFTKIDTPENVQLLLPQEYIPLYKLNNDIEYKHAFNYLLKREITVEDILKHKMGYCKEGIYSGRIIIPSFDVDGKLNYFMARDYRDVSKIKYKNPKTSKNVIGFENHINWNYPIVLVEGIFDAISLKRNAIPLFGKFISSKLREKIMSPIVTDIYVALDDDAITESLKMCKDLINNGKNVYLVRFNSKDASELGFEKSMDIIRNTKLINFNDLLKLKILVG